MLKKLTEKIWHSFDYFVPPNILEKQQSGLIVRLRVFAAMVLLGSPAPAIAFLPAETDKFFPAISLIAVSVIGLLILFLMKYEKINWNLGTGTYAVTCAFPIIAAAWTEAVPYSGVFQWFVLIPLFTIFLTNISAGIIITVAILIAHKLIYLKFGDGGLIAPTGMTDQIFIQSNYPDQVGSILVGLSIAVAFQLSRQKAERELRKSEQDLRGRDKQLAEQTRQLQIQGFSAGVAHEVNNPLMIISGNSNLLETLIESDSLTEAQVRKISERIRENCKRIHRITQSLRAYTQEESLNSNTYFRITDVFRDLHFKLDAENIVSDSLEIYYPQEEPICVRGKGSDVCKILMQLVKNSIDATEELMAPEIRISVNVTAALVRFTVFDNGEAIAPSVESKMYEPFFTTKPYNRVQGLGLSIVQGLLKGQGSDVVYKRLEHGKQFQFELPREFAKCTENAAS